MVWVRSSVGVVRDSAKRPTHLIGLIEDISKEKEAQEVALISEQRWQLALQVLV